MDQHESFMRVHRFQAERKRQQRTQIIIRTMRVALWIAVAMLIMVVGYAASMIPAKVAATILDARQERTEW